MIKHVYRFTCICCGLRTWSNEKNDTCFSCGVVKKDLPPDKKRYCRVCSKNLTPDRYFNCFRCVPNLEPENPFEVPLSTKASV